MEITVKGHSGCGVEIIKKEGVGLAIRKTSTDPSYFSRLIKQAEKQENAHTKEYQHIRVPKIYSKDKTDKSVDVIMEYVYSNNFIEYFEKAGFEKINFLIKALIKFIDSEVKTSSVVTLSSDFLIDKFRDVVKKIGKNPIINKDPEIQVLISRSSPYFETLKQITIPVGICHGDLTFSNILFNGNNYYLIDFLDSFIETPLMDIVKIRQDSAYRWSELLYSETYDQLRLQIIFQKIDSEIDEYFIKYDWYREFYKVFQLLNFWRIVQYAKEEKIISYLKSTLNQLLDEA